MICTVIASAAKQSRAATPDWIASSRSLSSGRPKAGPVGSSQRRLTHHDTPGPLMLTKTPHLFDDATQVTAGDSSWRGRTSDDYWAFVGPFGGATAATILRALIDHPQRAGDPLALTVNFCAPIAQGAFDLDVRLVKANRSTQHWCVELTQGGADVATLATAVFAERRPSWSHQPAEFPESPPPEQIQPYPKVAAPWVRQYYLRFVEASRVSAIHRKTR